MRGAHMAHADGAGTHLRVLVTECRAGWDCCTHWTSTEPFVCRLSRSGRPVRRVWAGMSSQWSSSCTRLRTWRRSWTETGGSRHLPDATNITSMQPISKVPSPLCCVCAVAERYARECRQHRFREKHARIDPRSEVCGWLYVAASRWAAKQRLAEL